MDAPPPPVPAPAVRDASSSDGRGSAATPKKDDDVVDVDATIGSSSRDPPPPPPDNDDAPSTTTVTVEEGDSEESTISPKRTYVVRFDGRSRGNPGRAGSGMVLYDGQGFKNLCVVAINCHGLLMAKQGMTEHVGMLWVQEVVMEWIPPAMEDGVVMEDSIRIYGVDATQISAMDVLLLKYALSTAKKKSSLLFRRSAGHAGY